MTEIIFLNHDRSKDDESRRQIRSKAAQHSHRIGPRKPKARKSTTKPSSRSRSLASEEPLQLSRRGSPISVATQTTAVSRGVVEDDDPQEDEEHWSSIVVTEPKPSMPRLGSYADEPFNSYPVPTQSWFGEALDYMGHFMRRGWSSLRATNAEQDDAMLWVRRVTMNDSTYFYMNMLSVMGDLVSRGQHEPRLLVWLTSQVVASINEALGDPLRSLAAGTILTVGRLALREIVVGDMKSGITFHRPAFARMLVMSGGVDALGLPPLVRSHLAWGDRMMTRKTGIKLSEIEPALANEPTFGTGSSSMVAIDDAEVLDSYLPFRTTKCESPKTQ